MNIDEVVQLLRQKRPGTIQKKKQLLFCQRFREYINNARKIFFVPKISIEQYMKNQKDLLFGEEFFRYEFIPKLLVEALEKVIEFIDKNKYSKELIYHHLYFQDYWSDEKEEMLNKVKKTINQNNWSFFNKIEDCSILSGILYDYLKEVIIYIINAEKIVLIFEDREFAFLLSEHLQQNELLDKEKRKILAEKIKICFRKIEFETLICLANFVNHLKPDDKNDKTAYNDFYKMLQKICLQILGFPDESAYNKINFSSNLFNRYKNEEFTNKNLNSYDFYKKFNNYDNLKNTHYNSYFKYKNTDKRNLNDNLNFRFRDKKPDYFGKSLKIINNKQTIKDENYPNNNLIKDFIDINLNNNRNNENNQIEIGKNDNFSTLNSMFYYSECLINLIEFLALIIEKDISNPECSFIKTKGASNNDFSPYMNRMLKNDLNLNKNSSYLNHSPFCLKIRQKETCFKPNIKNHNVLKAPDLIDNIIDFNDYKNQKLLCKSKGKEGELSESFSAVLNNSKLNCEYNRKIIINDPVIDLKEPIIGKFDEDLCLNYISNKLKKENESKLWNKVKKEKDVNHNKSSEISNNTQSEKFDFTNNQFINENYAFFKGLYKLLQNHFGNEVNLSISSEASFDNTESFKNTISPINKTHILKVNYKDIYDNKNSIIENDKNKIYDENNYIFQLNIKDSLAENHKNKGIDFISDSKNQEDINEFINILKQILEKNNKNSNYQEKNYKIGKKCDFIFNKNSEFNSFDIVKNNKNNIFNPYFISHKNLNYSNNLLNINSDEEKNMNLESNIENSFYSNKHLKFFDDINISKFLENSYIDWKSRFEKNETRLKKNYSSDDIFKINRYLNKTNDYLILKKNKEKSCILKNEEKICSNEFYNRKINKNLFNQSESSHNDDCINLGSLININIKKNKYKTLKSKKQNKFTNGLKSKMINVNNLNLSLIDKEYELSLLPLLIQRPKSANAKSKF